MLYNTSSWRKYEILALGGRFFIEKGRFVNCCDYICHTRCDKDIAVGIEWIKKAAQQGNEYAQYYLERLGETW